MCNTGCLHERGGAVHLLQLQIDLHCMASGTYPANWWTPDANWGPYSVKRARCNTGNASFDCGSFQAYSMHAAQPCDQSGAHNKQAG